MTTLFLVNRYKVGEKIIILRRLSTEEISSLQHVFVEKEFDDKDVGVAISLADAIRGKGWLSCDCNPTNVPLMTIGLSEKQNYYLQRMHARGIHQEDCPFGQTKTAYFQTASVTQPFKAKKMLGLCRAGKINTKKASQQTNATQRQASIPLHSLARILYTLIELAGLNQVDSDFPKSYDYRMSLEKLKEQTTEFFLDTSFPLKDFFWTFPNTQGMEQQLKKVSYHWPNTSRPHALCVAIAHRIQGKNIYFDFKSSTPVVVTVQGEIRQSSGFLAENSGPFLVVFVVTDTEEEKGVFLPRKAFYVPTYNNHTFLPVDSVQERNVLRGLMAFLKKIKTSNYHLTIKKPLFFQQEILNGHSQLFKPDFVIQTPAFPLCIEVMGLSDSTYQERKERTIACMEAIGKVIVFDATNLRDFERNLKKTEMTLMRFIEQAYNKKEIN